MSEQFKKLFKQTFLRIKLLKSLQPSVRYHPTWRNGLTASSQQLTSNFLTFEITKFEFYLP
jgi:hypothetical protein